MPAQKDGLERLMRPRSVAIVGASAEPGSIGGAVLGNLERCNYRGDIHLVSRRAKGGAEFAPAKAADSVGAGDLLVVDTQASDLPAVRFRLGG